MKFAKKLKHVAIECGPEWAPMFVEYKKLKKKLAKKSEAFPNLLRKELGKVNMFFLDKQHDLHQMYTAQSSIVQRALSGGAVSRAQVVQIQQDLVHLHSELVMLELFSSLNYDGFGKILKKYDKKEGTNLRKRCTFVLRQAPFYAIQYLNMLLQNVLELLAEIERISKFRRPASSNIQSQSNQAMDVVLYNSETGVESAQQPETHAQSSEIKRAGLESLQRSVTQVIQLDTMGNLCEVVLAASHGAIVPFVQNRLVWLLDQVSMRTVNLKPFFSSRFQSIMHSKLLRCETPTHLPFASKSFLPKPLSVDIIVIPQGHSMQLIGREEEAFIVKLFCGRCIVEGFEEKEPARNGEIQLKSVLQCTNACGSWPAWVFQGDSRHHTFTAKTNVILAYICVGGLSTRPMLTFVKRGTGSSDNNFHTYARMGTQLQVFGALDDSNLKVSHGKEESISELERNIAHRRS
mmetsp:Transcript_1028/g.1950  ORF Transcript_1028/g.1950 Transcript_1028/m.1950 type:complete len:462 (-) Transcript_1028:1286-2671(-)|eukprot:CAMPEP_0182446870 /NCGR_PEP_ID=MMETSP1172-20130603/7972_1 /TAXON_ID=708627 /ORGANISM="Timspurckia oligopyrenoides, Strain CCMP3278" /LENGTH=461 /DNA_ID=CAMNT_0024643021 /DNA_START=232 /DNA_END=1617 /DNA_ORIENTATION=+